MAFIVSWQAVAGSIIEQQDSFQVAIGGENGGFP